MIIHKKHHNKTLQIKSKSIKENKLIYKTKLRSNQRSYHGQTNPEAHEELRVNRSKSIFNKKNKKIIYSEPQTLNQNQSRFLKRDEKISERIIVDQSNEKQSNQLNKSIKISPKEQEIEQEVLLNSIKVLNARKKLFRDIKLQRQNKRYHTANQQYLLDFQVSSKLKNQQKTQQFFLPEINERASCKQLKHFHLPIKMKKITKFNCQSESNNSLEKISFNGKACKVENAISIQSKRSNELPRSRKITVMDKYDFQFQNIRLAQKLLKIKPTKVCDKSQHNKFFKKHEYYRNIRSSYIDTQDYLNQNISSISQSILLSKQSLPMDSFPRQIKRFYTIQN